MFTNRFTNMCTKKYTVYSCSFIYYSHIYTFIYYPADSAAHQCAGAAPPELDARGATQAIGVRKDAREHRRKDVRRVFVKMFVNVFVKVVVKVCAKVGVNFVYTKYTKYIKYELWKIHIIFCL